MQPGYGGVSEIQQFMADGCPPSLFPISAPPPPADPNAAAAAEIHHHQQKFYHLHQQQPQYHHHHQQQPSPPMPMPPQFSHLIHPIPITQQLFHHPHPHQFQLFHHHHHHHSLGLQDHDSAPEASGSPAPPRPSFLAPATNFKLGVDESSANEDHDGILRGDDGSESRLHSWHGEEESAASIKQPFWRPLDRDYINTNNKRPISPENNNNNNNSSSNYSKKSKEAVLIEHTANTAAVPAAAVGSNYKLFSELEAIYKPGSGGIVVGGGGGGSTPNNNQTGSGSALTSDDNPLLPGPAPCPTAADDNQQPDHGSDTSRSGDALPAAPPSSSTKKSRKGSSGSSSRRKQRAKRRQEQMGVITAFFESLVKQVMDHQESLHSKFLEVMERRDQERAGREEAWRKQEAARNVSKAASRAQERALAASREASIISFLEKITGESLDLPQFPSGKPHKDQECSALDLYDVDGGNNSITNCVQLNTSRWPKAEVQALIRVRSRLETRFQEPGLKGPLWEEVSSMMAAIGYQRSAKRCKEKWENINKYFRKTKDSGKKRPQHSKTCPYFHQLDQLYSKSSTAAPSSSANAAGVGDDARKENSELLDAIVVSNDHRSYKFPDIGSMRMTGIDGNEDQGNEEAGSSAMAGKSHGNYEDDDDDNGEGADEEEGEGDSQYQQGHAHERVDRDGQNEHHHHLHQGLEDPQHDSTFFFQRLRS
ncbi:putative trihelix transcription factor GTL1 [Iris pallida]|uniref:Trihelix transcription factor GTL1 n=1 Tax=Iris pallida TaxID=29817 RepID=A0AAX6E002_IRIPA|nr:putative trihelix transcription factor GTL1 [Iris pallida]